MEWKERAAVVCALATRLKDKGSWCGETHLQKAIYFLQELREVPLGYEFILYKHGPFSFDFRDDLGLFRSRSVLRLEPQPAPYGPSYVVTEVGHDLLAENVDLVGSYSAELDAVADQLAGVGTVGLERLSTALHVTKELGRDAAVDRRAARLVELKPHIELQAAENAVGAIDQMLERR
jgi:hypothetical protein